MEFVKKEIRNGIAYITIDRPPVNALVRQAYDEIGSAFNSVFDELDEVRAVIFTGAGKQFIAGNDLNETENMSVAEMNEQAAYYSRCLQHIYHCPVPVIGAINGAAIGMGFCMAALCDVLVAADNARFGLPELKVGSIGGLAFLPLMIPQKVGKYMTLTGEYVSAEQMLSYGSVHSVVPRDQLIAEAERIADKVKAVPPLGARAWKRAWLNLEKVDFSNIEHMTDLFIYDLMSTEDAAEASRAFLEKRTPVFKGR